MSNSDFAEGRVSRRSNRFCRDISRTERLKERILHVLEVTYDIQVKLTD